MNKKTKSVISGTIVCLVLMLGVGAIGTATKGFVDWETKNWGSNFEDLFNPNDGTTVKKELLNVDETSENKTYLMPAKSLNFGNSKFSDDSKEEVVKTLQEDSGTNSLFSTNSLLAASNPLTFPQTINLTATVTPVESESYCEFLWEIDWSNDVEDDIHQYIKLENATTKNVAVKVLKAFSHTATLKVTATAQGILPVSDTCSVEFYKQLEGIDLKMTGSVQDKVLNIGDQITYTIEESYSTGTIDQEDMTEVVVSYTSLISDYKINYDFKKNESTGFDLNTFYNASGNFTGVNVLTGAGRNKMNAKLKISSGDFKITATKGKFSKAINLDIEPETVIYPESIQIGNGEDIEIGKN